MKSDGFSLIEVMIAMVILMFGVLSVAPLFVLGAKQEAAAEDMSYVGAAAVHKLEELRGSSFNSLAVGDYTDSTGETELLWYIEDIDSNTKLIEVSSIAFRQVIGERKRITMKTVRSR